MIAYAIIYGNHDNSFIINSTTGVITTAKPLDRETQSQFVLTVRASDSKCDIDIIFIPANCMMSL